MGKIDILIAEDDAVLREVYTKKFTMEGYSIRTAANGEEALAELQKKTSDIMILDINMPVLDGFAVLEKCPRAQRSYPIIMLTNFSDPSNRQRGDDLGADDYFIKSEMTIRKLLEMVETMLKAKEYWGKQKT
tara:strand:- start:285 stop:680 length:396 start_codon:yes stop_codon:yes gene_type:complete